MTSGAKRGLIYLVVVGILLDVGQFYLLSRSISAITVQQRSGCKFYDDLGAAPVAEVNGKASLLGVTIVSDARVAWHEGGCPGEQQAASSSFLKWAKVYKLPVD